MHFEIDDEFIAKQNEKRRIEVAADLRRDTPDLQEPRRHQRVRELLR